MSIVLSLVVVVQVCRKSEVLLQVCRKSGGGATSAL